MKREYIGLIQILIRLKNNENISNLEKEMLNKSIDSDKEFKFIAEKIINEDYLTQISEYLNNNVEDKIKANVYNSIELIKKKRKKRTLTISLGSMAVAMIAIIITIGANLNSKNGNNNTISYLNKISDISKNSITEDIILFTEKGNNIKLEGTIFNANDQIIKDTIDNTPILDNAISTVVIPLKKDFNIILSDGTKVWLNSGSRLSFPNKFSKNDRIVEIDGEGYFEVTHDSLRPFIVKSLVMDTKVLGTKFLVSAYSEDNSRSISLIEGSVEVSSSISDYVSRISSGKGVLFNVTKQKFQNIDVNINNIILKVNGSLVFENESLSTICNALSRRYAVEFTIKNHTLENKQFYIRIKKYNSIEDVLELLSAAGDIKYELENNKITIY